MEEANKFVVSLFFFFEFLPGQLAAQSDATNNWGIEQRTGESNWYIRGGEGPTREGGGEFEKEDKG